MCLWHAPAGPAPRALLVHVHAFGEEMNKSRRMVATTSRALAESGAAAVLQWDLLGCGDSAGESEDATWSLWLSDVKEAARLARHRASQLWPDSPAPELWLWGQRAGCLLAAQALAELDGDPWNLMFWQPVAQGRTVMQQLLRMDAAAAMMGKPGGGSGPNAKAKLAAGQVAEIAGYRLQPAMAQGLEAATLRAPAQGRRLEWLDVALQPDTLPSPAAQSVLQQWRSQGWAVRHHAVAGPAFWQTTEIEDAPDLVGATLAALQPLASYTGPALADAEIV
ncbi:hypothetical protein D621_11665 [beta proteobacterium AAP51]|nr:hypothetical protein D621_11665 [beta proteobacterium AAP51]